MELRGSTVAKVGCLGTPGICEEVRFSKS